MKNAESIMAAFHIYSTSFKTSVCFKIKSPNMPKKVTERKGQLANQLLYLLQLNGKLIKMMIFTASA